MTIPPISYPIYDGAKRVVLDVYYKKKRIEKICHQEDGNIVVRVRDLWINDFRAKYLKKFRSSVMPCEDKQSNQIEGGKYRFYFDNWSWVSPKREVRSITIHYVWLETTSGSFTVPSCLRILGLKERLEIPLGKLEDEDYLLYYRDLPMSDNRTLDEYGIENDALIKVTSESRIASSHSFTQMATGGTYSSVKYFNKYFSQIAEKIGIVCQIMLTSHDDGGTGFLIGPFLIMTNHHVSKDFEKPIAKFFYHGTAQDEIIEVKLRKESVCFSQSPKRAELPNSRALDYAVFRLEPSNLVTEGQLENLKNLGRVAEDLFKKSRRKLTNSSQSSSEGSIAKEKKKFSRANIIQHPTLSESQGPKQIAFRDNEVTHPGVVQLHYKSTTRPGSSGSPVINDSGLWIGLHSSECIVINKKLFKYRKALCNRLGFKRIKKEDAKEIYRKENEPPLYVYKDKFEGSYSRDISGKKFSLKELVIEWVKQNARGLSPSQKHSRLVIFIFDFLKEQDPDTKLKNVEGHIYCNTAINAKIIFEDLLKNNETKLKQIEEAKKAAREEWETYALKFQKKEKTKPHKKEKTPTPKVREEGSYVTIVVVSLAVIAVVGVVFWRIRLKKIA